MKKYVLDSYALLAYAENEVGSQAVSEILKDALSGKSTIYVSVINWGEMYFIALRESGKIKAELYRNLFEEYPIKIIDADQKITLLAAELKATNRISYADSFAAALAKQKDAELVTGDTEFKQLENQIKVVWI
ncbi:MAG: type II toxin-antitoxin system VapC family toxin [Candidatus Marinimicrobia bacterium]|nr:type II toxin-antitoxin system VapC family toxin [Candidatus Neomarinimicrobiota bacterium]